jgi:hypothetical protein
MATDDDDKKVKELLDDASTVSEEDLARWFSLPSFQQLAEQPPPPAPVVDEQMQEVIERRQRALEAVDPAFVARLEERVEQRPETLIQFSPKIDVCVDERFGLLDASMIDRGFSIAEPREVEVPEELRDDLKDCTPQALLRDLHRAVFDFDKMFEVVDYGAEQRVDIAADVRGVMATDWRLRELGSSSFAEGRALVEDLRDQRHRSWVTEVLPTLRNRTVTE